MYFVNRQLRRGVPQGPSLFIAYLFWLCSGFMGLHRFYLRSNWGFVFIPVFLAILYTTDEIRDRREDVPRTRAASETAITQLSRAQIPAGTTATAQQQDTLAKAQAAEAKTKSEYADAQGNLERWRSYSR